MLSSAGLPGLNGFVGEFLLLLGSFRYAWWLWALAAVSVVLGAVYLLWMTQRVLFEKDRSPEKTGFWDFSLREKLIMTPIVLAMFFIGLFPAGLTDRLEPAARQIIAVSAPGTAREAMPAAEANILAEGGTHGLQHSRR